MWASAKTGRTMLDVSHPVAPCPWLPAVDRYHDASITRRHAGDKGPGFYRDARSYAQSLWLEGKPAQAILQLNKAWMADLAENAPILQTDPPPYRALVWILTEAKTGEKGFLGNPVRHFQHLASRMSGPRAEIRSWRAWICFHLANRLLPGGEFPKDGVQLAREGLWIPGWNRSLDEIAKRGWSGEVSEIQKVARDF
jgi:hypothetical protein